MKIYHGSEFIIEKPEYGKGKPYNDYGKGFYCTENIELAKEWSCDENHDGYANAYELNLDGLKILKLNSDEYNILHWLTILVQNRTFRLSNPLAKDAKVYLIENFSKDISGYDVIVGYRADNSYFAFAEDFLNNTISVSKLSKSMRLGNLGEQVVLMSEKAFSNLTFIEAMKANKSKYYVLKTKRDKAARGEYLKGDRKPSYSTDELYVLDLMRQGVKQMYPTYHEADISKAVLSMERMIQKKERRSISELRILRGWSQAQLADMAGMSISQLQRLEYGERKTDNMTLKSAVALANALGVDVETLLLDDDKNNVQG